MTYQQLVLPGFEEAMKVRTPRDPSEAIRFYINGWISMAEMHAITRRA